MRRSYPFAEWVTILRETQWTLIGSCILIIAIVFSIQGQLHLLKVNYAFLAFFFASAVFIVISGFGVFIGQGIRPFAIAIIVLFPVFYFVWANRDDYSLLYKILSIAVVVSGLVFIALCLIIEPPALTGRYAGITYNPNTIGTIMSVVFVCSIYLIFTARKLLAIVSMISFILSLLMIVLADCRTAYFIIVAVVVICVVRLVQLFHEDKTYGKLVLLRLIVVVGIIIGAGFLFLLYQNSINGTNTGSLFDSPRIKYSLAVLFSDRDLYTTFDRILSGRLSIWGNYADAIQFRGHDAHELPLSAKGVPMLAHNNVLDIAYRSGLPAGIAYAGFLISSLVFSLRSFFKKGERKEHSLFVAMIVFCYFITVMFETMLSMTLYPIVIVFFLSLGPLLFKKL